jgi:methyl-accepting chemotaxis protein
MTKGDPQDNTTLILQQIEKLSEKVDKYFTYLDQKIDRAYRDLDQKISEVHREMIDNFKYLNQRIDSLSQRIDSLSSNVANLSQQSFFNTIIIITTIVLTGISIIIAMVWHKTERNNSGSANVHVSRQLAELHRELRSISESLKEVAKCLQERVRELEEYYGGQRMTYIERLTGQRLWKTDYEAARVQLRHSS